MTAAPSPAPVGRLVDTVLDCPDAELLASFWCSVLGFEVSHREDGWVSIEGEGCRVSFQQVAGYRAPGWPTQAVPQQMHLDVLVVDLEAAGRRIVGLGARPRGGAQRG